MHLTSACHFTNDSSPEQPFALVLEVVCNHKWTFNSKVPVQNFCQTLLLSNKCLNVKADQIIIMQSALYVGQNDRNPMTTN